MNVKKKVESRKNNTDMKINMKSEAFNNELKLLHQNINEGGGGRRVSASISLSHCAGSMFF